MIYKFFTLMFSFFMIAIFTLDAKAINISKPIKGSYIITVKEGQSVEKLAEKHQIKILKKYSKVFNGANVSISDEKAELLKADPSVETVVQDFTIEAFKVNTNATMTGMSGGTTTQIIPTGINWIDAELNTTNEGSGVTVAVLDTGIDFTHSDLMVNQTLSRDFTTDGTGGNDNNKTSGGHGTHVAGIIAALNNSRGVLGVGSQI